MPKYLIVGGSDAGISAALRIKELQPNTEVILFLKDTYPNYSICGIPFYLSGEIKDWQSLAHRTKEIINDAGIVVIENTEIIGLDARGKVISTANKRYPYDKLLMATGAVSVMPPIIGNELKGVFTLRWIDEMFAVDHYLREAKCRNAVIIGGGYIGVEMADALTRRGLYVTLVEPSASVLKTLDIDFGLKVQEELLNKGVQVINGKRVTQIQETIDALEVKGDNGLILKADIVLLVTGAKPNTALADGTSLKLGPSGAYQTDQQMRSSIPDIYVAGDCCETFHSILNTFVYQPLGTTSHKQGRIAGEAMCGEKGVFKGIVGTQVVKVFDLIAGRTGLHDRDCENHSIPHLTVESEHWDHKQYYPGARKLWIRITGNPLTGMLLGMQIIGFSTSEVSKRLDIAAVAIQNCLSVLQLNELDLSYTPPLSSPWDPVQLAAQAWLQHLTAEETNL